MLEVNNLTKTFSVGVNALSRVSFHIEKGEFVAVLGPSGSGKSTLFQCMIRLIEPSEGEIFIDGSEILTLKGRELNNARKKVGVIFQQYNLSQRMSAFSNVLAGRLPHVSFWSVLFRYFSPFDRELALSCLDCVGLRENKEQRADTLSGGQQQRVAIARALAQKPLLLLADEPVSNLDPQSAIRVMDVLKTINEEEGITVVCSLHQVDLATQYATRIIGLNRGQVVVDHKGTSLTEQQREKIYGSLSL